ncbi:MAG: hypothetical protein JWO38_4073 [Gemmataceae bacterium]|nr:hypothetical protein [Gemmataceae bacterium]
MRWYAGLILGLLAAATGRADDPAKPSPSTKDELQRFQGTWQVEAWEEGGKAVAAGDVKERAVFFGGNVFIFRRGGKVYQAGSVQLDPSKSPRTVNLVVKEGEGKDGVLLGVYALDGDTLKLCFDPQGQTRPGGFKPDAKAGFAVATLRKPKPPADERLEIVGRYRSELVEANGKVVTTEAQIERRGDAYLVTYTQGEKLLFVGTALRKGDQLSMCWVSTGQAGVSMYKIEKGPKLVGEYTTLAGIGVTGKEILTPWREED